MTHLDPLALQSVPLGSFAPRGWLRDQLQIQADGLTGHIDEFWPPISQSRWIGGQSEGWERGPYWLDGLIPLAFLLNDERLIAKARHWVDTILENQHEDGWLGEKQDWHDGKPLENPDPWPLFVLFKAFLGWHSATDDARVVPAMLRCARRVDELLREQPLKSWAKMRWGDWIFDLHALYELTGEAWLLDAAARAQSQGFDWNDQFEKRIPHEKSDLTGLNWDEMLALHGVNNAMGIKNSALWSRQSGQESDRDAAVFALKQLDLFHGQANGMFSGDEHLAGRSPVQGTETCSVVELMFSLETLLAATGDASFADRLENIAFNALPAAMNKLMWTRQYDQQPNQVQCSVARRDWVSNDENSNLFSLEGHYGCCTANLHQGWPKFAAHAWMKSPDGFALVAPLPGELSGEIGGQTVKLSVESEYPFRKTAQISVEIAAPTSFELLIRVPAWARGAQAQIGEETLELEAETMAKIERIWRDGDVLTLHFPMPLRLEARDNGAVSVWRGPLLFGLHIEEEFRFLRGEAPRGDCEVHPKSPWNYALLPEISQFAVEEHPVSPIPFDNRNFPVVIVAPARQIEWPMHNDSAAPPPVSPVESQSEVEEVELVPFGATYLRISEFPTML